jgi:hypothetical protein
VQEGLRIGTRRRTREFRAAYRYRQQPLWESPNLILGDRPCKLPDLCVESLCVPSKSWRLYSSGKSSTRRELIMVDLGATRRIGRVDRVTQRTAQTLSTYIRVFIASATLYWRPLIQVPWAPSPPRPSSEAKSSKAGGYCWRRTCSWYVRVVDPDHPRKLLNRS